MNSLDNVEDLRRMVRRGRESGMSVGFVPTMGFLHPGHIRLIHECRRENELVVVSAYVNPAQFGPAEDFAMYPREIERDRDLAAEAGADIFFSPDDETMYPGGVGNQAVWVDPGNLATVLCGASRPGHFRGVATVVAKLLNIVRPDRLYLGQKDAQQAIIISRMVRDLSLPVDVRVIETVREQDGLAMSSRNAYLTDGERREAAAIHRALAASEDAFQRGERSARLLEVLTREVLARDAPRGRVEYVEAARLDRLTPVTAGIAEPALLAVAVHFGRTRLIDNVILNPRLEKD